MTGLRPAAAPPGPTDEQLVRELARGRQDALGPLYGRYARLIFSLAAHTLDRAAAEEIVQDVFLTVWRKAAAFDPARGAFRAWILQIAHFRILNELRHRSRRPRAESDPEGRLLAAVPDPEPEPDEAAWRASLGDAVRAALEDLPPAQRKAVDLAFFEDLTHQEVASTLNVPLGTAKTRIRNGLARMRGKLAPVAAGLALVLVVAGGVRYYSERTAFLRDERALALVTTSETKVLRLAAAPGVVAAPGATEPPHGQYRGRAGVALAVLSVSHFRAAPAGEVYQGWVGHGGVWTPLGPIRLDARGDGRVIAEGTALAVLPDAVEVTLEPARRGAAPSGPVVIAWPAR